MSLMIYQAVQQLLDELTICNRLEHVAFRASLCEPPEYQRYYMAWSIAACQRWRVLQSRINGMIGNEAWSWSREDRAFCMEEYMARQLLDKDLFEAM